MTALFFGTVGAATDSHLAAERALRIFRSQAQFDQQQDQVWQQSTQRQNLVACSVKAAHSFGDQVVWESGETMPVGKWLDTIHGHLEGALPAGAPAFWFRPNYFNKELYTVFPVDRALMENQAVWYETC